MDTLEDRPLPEKYLLSPAERSHKDSNRINKEKSDSQRGENGLRSDYVPTAHVSPRSSSVQRSPSHREWVEPRMRQTNSVEDLLRRPSWETSSHKQLTDTGLKQWNSYTNIDKEEFSAPNITLDQSQFGEPSIPCNLTLPSRSYPTAAHHSSQPSLYGQGRDLAGVRTASHTTPPQMIIDMTQWQQSQPAALTQNLFGGSGLVGTGVSSSLTYTDPHKWDALHRAADSIVKEKDGIIDKQKQEILQLRNHVDLQRQREQITRAQEQSELLNMQLQEYQYESAQLKAMLTEAVSSKTAEVDKANRKLGEVEYELRQMQLKTNRENTSKQKEVTDLQKKLSSQETLTMEWKAKYAELKEDYGQIRQKMMGLEGYIADLPTADEHSKKTSELKSLLEYKSTNEKRISELENQLHDVSKAIKARDSLIQSLEVTERNLSDEISKYKKQNEKLRQQLLGNNGDAPDSADPSPANEELNQLRQDNQKLRSDIEKAKKIIEVKQRKVRHLEAKMKTELAQKDEQINQDESVASMMREIKQRDEQIKTLHSTVKEVASQNQDLMEENMILKNRVKDVSDTVTGLAGEMHRLQHRLQNELIVCVGELQSLVQICVQRSQGQDPNISILLGVRGTNTQEASGQASSLDVQGLTSMIEKVRDLRGDVDNLRELISNKYAEDMGDNLTCATQ